MADDDSASTVSSLVRSITAAVREGRLAPGQRLTEGEFTRRHGVSRPSVREAFRRLTADGLLAFEPNRGVTVRQLSRAEIDNLFQVRGALETLAVRLSFDALHASPDVLLALQSELDAAVASGDMNRFSDLNARFHRLFIDASGNPLLGELLGRLTNSIYWLQFRVLVDRSEVFDTNRQHRAVTDAITAGNLAVAQAAMLDHVETSRRLIQSLSDEHFAVVSASPSG